MPGLRKDAVRNRQRLIEAAGEVLREQGMDASLEEVARRAGVGSATLYRHFPTRELLYEAVFAETAATLDRVCDQVLAMTDPWLALCAFFEQACAFIAEDRGLSDLMVQGHAVSVGLNELRVRADACIQTLLERAQQHGVVRDDLRLTDVLFMLLSLMRMVPASAAVSSDAWRRHLAITLEGLRPREGSILPPVSLSYEQLLRVGEYFNQRQLASG